MKNKVEELFSATVALPATKREFFLTRACGDPDLRGQVRELVQAFTPAQTFLADDRALSFPDAADGLIDDYRLVQEIGEGGGGVVYLAKQLRPIRREVALKIIKLGMDTRAVINRFEAERQALALMDHPSIARVFDAGATAAGRPYFVMELVRGLRITDYCRLCALTLEERLRLFMQVCNAIEHAHQQGVIHRDIKPSNVLVTLHGGEPLVKVIDFGIAKARQGALTEGTLYTLVDQFIGTPAYVSPEQTELTDANVDARSDIYSLGALLYELLTGCTPLDPRELEGATLEQVRRRIREETPLTPSRRIQTGASRREASQGDAITARRLRGDLDWIVMRSLEKEKDRRYRSARDLSAEIARFLRGEPVIARPPSLVYTVRKLAARHRVMFAAVSAIICILVAATGVSTWQAVRAIRAETLARQESERAEQVSQFLLDVFSAADPLLNSGREPTARALLEKAARNIQNDSDLQPDVRARLLETIGRSFRRLGRPEHALSYLRDALQITQSTQSLDDASSGSLVTELAIALRNAGRVKESDHYFAIALNHLAQTNMTGSEVHAELLMDLSRLESMRGNTEQSLHYAGSALRLMRELKGDSDPAVGSILADMSTMMVWADDLEGAERSAREAAAVFKKVPEHHPDRMMTDFFLGEILLFRGRVEESSVLLERALAAQRRVYGSVNSIVTDTLGVLAQVRLEQGRNAEAETLVSEALEALRASQSTAYLKVGYLRTMLGMIWIKAGKFAHAEEVLREALALFAKHVAADHQYVASAEYYLGESLIGQGSFADAKQVLMDSMERWKRAGAPPWRSARSANALGMVLHELGSCSIAEQYLVSSYRVLIDEPAANAEAKRNARERVGRFYRDLGQPDKADALFSSTGEPATDSAALTAVAPRAAGPAQAMSAWSP